MTRWLLLSLTAVTLFIAGCGRDTTPQVGDARSCDEIAAVGLRALLKETLMPEAMRKRLAETYQVSLQDVEFNLHEDNTAFLNVVKNGMSHTIRMKGMHPSEGSVTFNSQRPSVAKATQCLGEPRWYWAYYFFGPGGPDHMLELSIFIPAQGAWIDASTYGKDKRPPPVDGRVPVSFVAFVVPSVNEAATMTQLLDVIGPSLRGQIESQMKPWPGKWEAIQVEVDPGLQ